MVKTKKLPSKDEKPEQLSLGLKSPFKNYFFDFKNRISSRFSLFEANTFINDAVIWILACLQIVGAFSQLLYILNSLPKLPSLLPLFGFNDISSLSLVPKLVFIVFPIISLSIFMLTFKSARSIYFKNDTLAIYILFIGSLINLSISLFLVRIISLYV